MLAMDTAVVDLLSHVMGHYNGGNLGPEMLIELLSLCFWSMRPAQPSHGGGKAGVVGFQLLSQREQSEPFVCGHGLHGPLTSAFSHSSHAYGSSPVSLAPGRQRGPSCTDGMGSRAHIEPLGLVPSLTKTPASGSQLEVPP